MDIAKKKRSTAGTCFMGEISFAAANSAVRGKGGQGSVRTTVFRGEKNLNRKTVPRNG
jgi:hypothetical protein